VLAWSDLRIDEAIARRLLIVARSIAPGLSVLDGEAKNDAIAILQGIAEEAAARGPRFISSQSVGPASVSYSAVRSWFSDDERAALRALVAGASGAAAPGLPVGNFPKPNTTIGRIWPEDYS
jgi:hypothetical protein